MKNSPQQTMEGYDMNTLTTWNPFREMEELQNRLSSILGRRTPARAAEQDENMTVAEWAPLVDIIESDKEYVIKAEVPEIRKEDLKITVENGVLTIKGERKFEKEEKGKRYHRVERSYGSFMRGFSLPDDADPGKVNAEFKDGLLAVHVAKSEAAKPKQIEISVS
jgi:HSP20 family protein